MRYSGHMRSVPAAAVAVAATLAAAGAGGCHASSTDEHRAPASSDAAVVAGPARNAQDVAFLQDMIPHHEQALELSAMVPDRSTNPELVELAQRIAYQQRSELDAFRAQLMQWEFPLANPHQTDRHGMVDQATMDHLATLRGAGFDRLWLQSMIDHHRGAITMAQTEIARGQSPDIIGMAKSVAASQQAEVDQMNQMLEVE